MNSTDFYIATKTDIPFISETYNQNINELHGINRTFDDWDKLLTDEKSTYYIVRTTEPVAWFRTEITDNILWLGMLQVKVEFQHQGLGKCILSFVENLAKSNNIKQLGIHTTEDNMVARNLYQSFGYTVSEIGKCTTADSVERIGYTFIKNI